MVNPFKSRDRTSLIVLVAANLLPLGGVLFAGWDAGMIVLLYWAENLILGFYTILRIAFVKAAPMPNAAKAFIIPFFCVHYGMFCFVHGIFVLLLVSMGLGSRSGGSEPDLSRLASALAKMPWPLAALFVSHGVSFVQNYLIHGEYATTSVRAEMMQPYGRIVMLHLVIMFAALPTMLFGSPWPLVALLVVGKIVIDLVLHTRMHRKAAQSNGTSELP